MVIYCGTGIEIDISFSSKIITRTSHRTTLQNYSPSESCLESDCGSKTWIRMAKSYYKIWHPPMLTGQIRYISTRQFIPQTANCRMILPVLVAARDSNQDKLCFHTPHKSSAITKNRITAELPIIIDQWIILRSNNRSVIINRILMAAQCK
jgi:hypothetical protein